jgi:hypothetical protein
MNVELAEFSEILKEAEWRMHLLSKIGCGTSPFLNVFIASPSTLLVLCIR